jgi:membrane-associated phospholipid phosphatase
MRTATSVRVMFLAAFAMWTAACGTLPSGQPWGARATMTPGWTRLGEAARSAATDPWVWVPLLAAAALQIDDLDRRASDWARDHTPVFDSADDARDWSDRLRSTSTGVWLVTLVATPGGDEPGEWFVNKLKGAAVEASAVVVTGAVTVRLKDAADRERPDAFDRKSFPSGHASASAVHGQLAKYNLDAIPMRPALRRTARVATDALMLGTGWARVEAGVHFPSDVLAGYALGTFVASFATRAFFPENDAASIAFALLEDGMMLRWTARY